MDETTLRIYFHTLLTGAFTDLKAYFRPPGDLILSRPCIVYDTLQAEPSFANNKAYVVGSRFQVTFLSNRPGYMNSRKIYDIDGIVVISNNSFEDDDVIHDVYRITVNSI